MPGLRACSLSLRFTVFIQPDKYLPVPQLGTALTCSGGSCGECWAVFYFLVGVMQRELAVAKGGVNHRVCTSK